MSKILEAAQLEVSYGGVPILRDVSLELNKGEILGIVGESGCGKSTLLKAIIGLLGENGRVERGSLVFDGIDLLRAGKGEMQSLRGARLGMVFQNPAMSFNPIRKIGVQFFEALKAHGKVDRQSALRQILETFSRLNLRDGERILNSYPFELSGGMNQRVAIALAMVMNPALLLADEPTSALDVTVQAQCVREMMDLRDQLGTAILVVSHNMGVISYLSDKVAVMYGGVMVEYGKKESVMRAPRHPYTKALIRAIPVLGGGPLAGIPGTPPAFGEQTAGCPFAPRCPEARPACAMQPALQKTDCGEGHWTLCPYGGEG